MSKEAFERYKNPLLKYSEAYLVQHPVVMGRIVQGILDIPRLRVYGGKEVFPQVMRYKRVGSMVALIIGHQSDLDWPLPGQRILRGSLGFNGPDTEVIASVKHRGQDEIDAMGLGPSLDQCGIEGLPPISVAASDGYEQIMGYERLYVVQRYLMDRLGPRGQLIANNLSSESMKQAADFLAEKPGRVLGVLGEATRNHKPGLLRIQRGSTVPFMRRGNTACLPFVLMDTCKLQSQSHSGLLGLRPVNVIHMKVGPILTYDDLRQARSAYEWSERALEEDESLGRFNLEDTLAMIALEGVDLPTKVEGCDPRGVYAYSNVIKKK